MAPKFKPPKVAAYTPLPTVADPAVEAAARRQALADANAKGRKSTILTGSTGLEETNTKKKTLLGA